MMDASDITSINLVQAICLRPRMYTQHGNVAEVYALLSDEKAPQPIAGNRDDASVLATLEWLHTEFLNTEDIAAELLAKYGSDAAALDAIGKFASTLPPE